MWRKLVLSYCEVASYIYMIGLRIITSHLTEHSQFRAEILNLVPSKYEARVNQLTAFFGEYDIRKNSFVRNTEDYNVTVRDLSSSASRNAKKHCCFDVSRDSAAWLSDKDEEEKPWWLLTGENQNSQRKYILVRNRNCLLCAALHLCENDYYSTL